MSTKPKMKKVTEAVPASRNGNIPKAAKPDYKLIPWKDLQPSPTNPRRRSDEKKLESLVASIGTQGILEPLIVRLAGRKHQIVCGERRYRAAQMAGLNELPCLVRELSDDQVLDIQIHENLHREDIHPMDEAYSYQFLKEKLNCNVKELALRVGKPEGYVLNRLKLNLLIGEAQKDIDDSYLPLVYALEIAKYPADIQKIIYGEVYRKKGEYQGERYVEIPVKGQTIPFQSFVEWIDTYIHRLLSKAPFDPKATNLRPDGLACIKCPDRTGANIGLFESNRIGKKDACLNPVCFQLKTETFVGGRRQELAEAAEVEPNDIPIVRSFCYVDGEDYLGTGSATVIGDTRRGSTKKCKNAVNGIDVEADNYGQIVQVCLRTSDCKVHWTETKASLTGDPTEAGLSGNGDVERLEAHRARREEIWNAKIAEAVRVRVFKQAAEMFGRKFSITNVGSDLLPQLIARFWRMTATGDSNNLRGVVKDLLDEWQERSNSEDGIHISEGLAGIEYFSKLTKEMQFRVLFLLIYCHKGTTGFNNSYSSQKEVRELAAEFKVDYPLIDAEVRLEFSSKKHKEIHQMYLDAVRGNEKDAKVPHLFSEKWKARD